MYHGQIGSPKNKILLYKGDGPYDFFITLANEINSDIKSIVNIDNNYKSTVSLECGTSAELCIIGSDDPVRTVSLKINNG